MLARVLQQEFSTTSRWPGVRLAQMDCFLAVGPSCQLLEELPCRSSYHSPRRFVNAVGIMLHSCATAAAGTRGCGRDTSARDARGSRGGGQ